MLLHANLCIYERRVCRRVVKCGTRWWCLDAFWFRCSGVKGVYARVLDHSMSFSIIFMHVRLNPFAKILFQSSIHAKTVLGDSD